MKTYSFADIVLLVNGVEITGWDEGDDVIQMDRLNDSASHIVGAGGEMVVSLSADRSGEVLFRLQQTSGSNQYLYGLVAAQEEGIFTPAFIQMKDTRGGDLGVGSQGYLPRPAGMTRGVNAQPQEWRVVVENLNMIYGSFGDVLPIEGGIG